jgi:hypothetical protein
LIWTNNTRSRLFILICKWVKSCVCWRRLCCSHHIRVSKNKMHKFNFTTSLPPPPFLLSTLLCIGLNQKKKWVVRFVNFLVVKLLGRFLTHGITNNLGMVHPQCWLLSNVKENFIKHLNVIKVSFLHPKKLGYNYTYGCLKLCWWFSLTFN